MLRTREVCAKIATYDAAVAKLSESKAEVQRQQREVDNLREIIIDRGAAAELTIAPTFHHAQAALDHMSANFDCTQVQVCKLLQEGELPGVYYGQRVKICQRYLSMYKTRLSEGKTIKVGAGRPVMLDKFQLDFINTVIEYGQIRNKAGALSPSCHSLHWLAQEATQIRLLLLGALGRPARRR